MSEKLADWMQKVALAERRPPQERLDRVSRLRKAKQERFAPRPVPHVVASPEDVEPEQHE